MKLTAARHTVAGGPEPYHVCYCPSFGDTEAVTRKAKLPPARRP